MPSLTNNTTLDENILLDKSTEGLEMMNNWDALKLGKPCSMLDLAVDVDQDEKTSDW